MKTILIPVVSTVVSRNILKTDVLKTLLRTPSVRVVLLVPHYKYGHYKQEFQQERVHVEKLTEHALSNALDRIYEVLKLGSVATNTIKVRQYHDFFVSEKILPIRLAILFRGRILWWLGKIPKWKIFLGWFFSCIWGDQFAGILNKYDVNLVYVASLRSPIETRLIVESRRQGIKVVGSTHGWDNLTVKVQVTNPPDAMLVPAEDFKSDLIRYNQYPADKIHLTGYTNYDKYFDKDYILPREEFMRGVSLDPSKPFILYAMAGPKNMKTDYEILCILRDALKEKKFGNVQILIRPYPKYSYLSLREEKFDKEPGFVFDHEVTHMLDGKYWELSDDDLQRLSNSLFHCALVITTASTILLEGMIFDKPVINLAFSGIEGEENTKIGYFRSPIRFLDREHMEFMHKGGYLKSATSKQELITYVKEYLENPSKDAEKRKQLVIHECAYTDGKSGERVGKILTSFL